MSLRQVLAELSGLGEATAEVSRAGRDLNLEIFEL